MCLIEAETIVISIPYLISIFSTRHHLFSPINHPSRGQCLGLHRPVIILKTSSNLTPREALKRRVLCWWGKYKLGLKVFCWFFHCWHLLVVRIVVYCYGLNSIDTIDNLYYITFFCEQNEKLREHPRAHIQYNVVYQ